MKINDYLEYPFESIRCNLCGADDTKIIATRSGYEIPLNTVICKRCSLIYHNPRMTLEGFKKFYEHDYRDLIESSITPEALFSQQVRQGNNILTFIGDHLAERSKVLEIGCGPGGLLSTFHKARSCDILGIEPAVEHVAWGKKKHGLNLVVGMWEEVELEEGSFDFIILTQTLNHLLDPMAAMRWIRSLLKPEGKLFVEVLDFVFLTSKCPLTSATKIDHPYMFCSQTLEAMLNKAGFDIVKWEIDADLNLQDNCYSAPEKGLPDTCVRGLMQRRKPNERIEYPSYRQILRSIRVNTWRRIQLITVVKGFARKMMGDRIYNKLKSVYYRVKGRI